MDQYRTGRWQHDRGGHLSVAHNARRDIAEIIGPVYQNNRDIHQSVLKFLNSSATVRQRTGHTDIILRAPNQKQEKAALQHLCETLTAMEKTSSLFPGNLVYHVQSPCYFLSITHESTQSTHDYL